MEHWVYLYSRVVKPHKLDTIGLRKTMSKRTRERTQSWVGKEMGWICKDLG